METFSRNDTKIAKFVAVTFMLLYHLFAFPEQYTGNIPYLSIIPSIDLEYIIGDFGNLCISIFVCLSGYGTFLAMKKSDDIEGVVLKKIYALYKKYWLVFIIIVPLLILIQPDTFSKNPSQIIINMVGLKWDYNMHWWFIAPFATLTIVSPYLINFIKKQCSSTVIDFLMIVFAETLIRYIIPALFELNFMKAFRASMFGGTISHVISFVPTFLLGAAIAKHGLFDKYLSFLKKRYAIILV